MWKYELEKIRDKAEILILPGDKHLNLLSGQDAHTGGTGGTGVNIQKINMGRNRSECQFVVREALPLCGGTSAAASSFSSQNSSDQLYHHRSEPLTQHALQIELVSKVVPALMNH